MKYLKKIVGFCLLFSICLLLCSALPGKASLLDDLKQQIQEKEAEIKQLEEQAKKKPNKRRTLFKIN